MSELVRLPPSLALGLGSDGLTAESARDRLAALGNDDPEVGHGLVDQLMETALQLVADGYPNPAQLARDTLTVCSADFPRWKA